MSWASSRQSFGSSSTPSPPPWLAFLSASSVPSVFHPEAIFRLRTCYGGLSPPWDIYENNRPFCTVDQGALLLDIGYHVRRFETPHRSADLVVTVGEHGDLWLPTDMITELFSVVINPETYLPLIRVGQSLPTYSAFVAHHETRGRLPGFQGPDPPIFQGEWINSGQSVALMPGRDYRLTVKTRHRGVKVGYTFDVVWEDEPIWKILEKLKSTFLKHRQDLLPGPTFDLPGYLRVSNVYWGGSEHRRIGKEAMVTSGTTIGADSCKKVAIKRFTESNPWANRKAAQNEIKRLQLMQHVSSHIVWSLGVEQIMLTTWSHISLTSSSTWATI